MAANAKEESSLQLTVYKKEHMQCSPPLLYILIFTGKLKNLRIGECYVITVKTWPFGLITKDRPLFFLPYLLKRTGDLLGFEGRSLALKSNTVQCIPVIYWPELIVRVPILLHHYTSPLEWGQISIEIDQYLCKKTF